MAERKVRREIGKWIKGNKAVFFKSSPDGIMYVIDIAGYTSENMPEQMRGKFSSEKAAIAALDAATNAVKLKHPRTKFSEETVNA